MYLNLECFAVQSVNVVNFVANYVSFLTFLVRSFDRYFFFYAQSSFLNLNAEWRVTIRIRVSGLVLGSRVQKRNLFLNRFYPGLLDGA